MAVTLTRRFSSPSDCDQVDELDPGTIRSRFGLTDRDQDDELALCGRACSRSTRVRPETFVQPESAAEVDDVLAAVGDVRAAVVGIASGRDV